MINFLIKFLILCSLALTAHTINAMDLPELPTKTSATKSESEMIHDLAEGIVDKIICDYEERLKPPSLIEDL